MKASAASSPPLRVAAGPPVSAIRKRPAPRTPPEQAASNERVVRHEPLDLRLASDPLHSVDVRDDGRELNHRQRRLDHPHPADLRELRGRLHRVDADSVAMRSTTRHHDVHLSHLPVPDPVVLTRREEAQAAVRSHAEQRGQKPPVSGHGSVADGIRACEELVQTPAVHPAANRILVEIRAAEIVVRDHSVLPARDARDASVTESAVCARCITVAGHARSVARIVLRVGHGTCRFCVPGEVSPPPRERRMR